MTPPAYLVAHLSTVQGVALSLLTVFAVALVAVARGMKGDKRE